MQNLLYCLLHTFFSFACANKTFSFACANKRFKKRTYFSLSDSQYDIFDYDNVDTVTSHSEINYLFHPVK